LLIIGANGVVADLGAITGLTTGANVGFFDAAGNYWLANSFGDGMLYKLDLNTRVATALPGQAGDIYSND